MKNTIDNNLSDCDEYILIMVMGNEPNFGESANLKSIIDTKVTSIGASFNLTLFGMDVSE